MKVDPKCETENKKDPPDLLCERVDLKSVSVDSKARNNHLRKMYLYLDADYDKISKLIDDLKTKNMTVAWTTEDKRDMAADINEFID